MMDIIPQFGNTAFTILAFVVALSIIVAIHEYGHYIVGRWCGIKAEVFSIGFGPVLVARVDRHGTCWQIAALPFGGYVKFLGDANAASVPDGQMAQTLAPDQARHTMQGAPLWARAATVAAGPVFNFILSILVFASVLMVSGRITDDAQVGTIYDLPPVYAGLQQGDVILEIAGQPVNSLGDIARISNAMDPTPTVQYRVERDGQRLNITAGFPMAPRIQMVAPQSAGFDAGLRPGDVIQSIDGMPVYGFSQIQTAVIDGAGAPMTLGIWRNGDTFTTIVAPRQTDTPLPDGGFETRYLIGINGGISFEPPRETFGIGAAAWRGVQQTGLIIQSSLSGLWHMITGAISSCNLQGPLGIAETSGQVAALGLDDFIWFIAVLSTAVGLMNLFPIPVLDGGHLVFHAYEAITRRPPSERVMGVLMSIGMALLLGLMIFAVTNDIFCP
jgi:regulator of sigma E protease